MTFSRESDLRECVAKYLMEGSFGLQQEEVQFYDYSIDQYGYSIARDETIAVELKLRKWSRALEQAIIYQLCADSVIIAMPSAAAHRVETAEFERHGIGLLAVLPDGNCEEVVTPRRSPVVRPHYRRIIIDHMREAGSCQT